MHGNQAERERIMKPRVNASTPQIIAINEKLKEVLQSIGEGMWQYKDQWSDEAVAKFISPDLNHTHIGRIRLECFGQIQARRPTSNRLDVEQLKADNHRLSMENSDIRSRLDAIELLHAKLCDSLSVNRVVDVKHLAGTAGKAALKAVK